MKKWLTVVWIALIGLTFLAARTEAFPPKEKYRDQVAVLMYHHVHDTDTSSSTVTAGLFRGQLAYLKERGYSFISLDQFKRFLDGGPVPPNAVLVTFDDGYESFYRNALPIMKELGVPAVNFLITERMDHPKNPYIPFLSREETRQMTAETEQAEIGCHTHNLHGKAEDGDGKGLLVARLQKDGRTETEAEYEARILADTRSCLDNLKPLTDKPADTMAYPYGIFDAKAARLVREAGIRYAFTIAPGMAVRDTDRTRIPRINAGSPNIPPEALDVMIRRRIVANP